MRLARLALPAVTLAGLGYGAWAALSYARYGSAPAPGRDPLLDRFIPRPDVWEHHQIHVNAPTDRAFEATRHLDLQGSRIVNALFSVRAFVMGSPKPERVSLPFVEALRSFGWVVLADVPGREIVFGAVTRPWEAAARFRSIPAEQFAAFDEPGYVKIIWNLAADPQEPGTSVLRTETRVGTTDAFARERFRRYWAGVLPGVKLIRHVMLWEAKQRAERSAGERRFVFHGMGELQSPS